MSTTRSVPVENPWTRWLSRCAWGAAEGAGAENGPFVLSTLSSKVEILTGLVSCSNQLRTHASRETFENRRHICADRHQ